MARKESKIEYFKITLELSAHMFYTVFTMLFEIVFTLSNTIIGGVMRHSDKFKSFIPDQTLDWFKKITKEAEDREASFKAAKDIIDDSFKNIKTTTTQNNIQDTVKENSKEVEIEVETVENKQEIKQETHKKTNEKHTSNKTYIDTIINITIGDVNIKNIENMNSLINALKKATKTVDECDYTKMRLDEVIDLREKINNYISEVKQKEYDNNKRE